MIQLGCFCGGVTIQDWRVSPDVILEEILVRCSECPEDPEYEEGAAPIHSGWPVIVVTIKPAPSNDATSTEAPSRRIPESAFDPEAWWRQRRIDP